MQASPKSGHYEEKLVRSTCPLIRLSHGSRFRKAVRLTEGFRPQSVLDYGCGDGYFLSLLSPSIKRRLGSDLNLTQLEDCRQRYRGVGIDFVDLAGLKKRNEFFDVVLCMEVLEHCEDPVVRSILSDCQKACAEEGRVILSVPIEVGLAAVAKWAIRKIAGWIVNKDYSYYESFSAKELLKTLFATPRTRLERTSIETNGAVSFTHKGFDWRKLKTVVEDYFHVEKTEFTPFPGLGSQVNSQVWFICKRKI